MTIAKWKQHILDLETQQGCKNLTERRCLNRFLNGGGDTEQYMMFMRALKAGGWMPEWISQMNIFKTSESVKLMGVMQEEMKNFCDALESSKSFPDNTFAQLLNTSEKLCQSEDMQALRDNPEETERMINELQVKENESRMSYMTRVSKWAWRNKWSIFKVSTVLFLAYLLWCWFTAGIGCWLATSLFSIVGYEGGKETVKEVVKKATEKASDEAVEYGKKASGQAAKEAAKQAVQKWSAYGGKYGITKKVVKEYAKKASKKAAKKAAKNAARMYRYANTGAIRKGYANLAFPDLRGGAGTNLFLQTMETFLDAHPKYKRAEKWFVFWKKYQARNMHTNNNPCDNSQILQSVEHVKNKKATKNKS